MGTQKWVTTLSLKTNHPPTSLSHLLYSRPPLLFYFRFFFSPLTGPVLSLPLFNRGRLIFLLTVSSSSQQNRPATTHGLSLPRPKQKKQNHRPQLSHTPNRNRSSSLTDPATLASLSLSNSTNNGTHRSQTGQLSSFSSSAVHRFTISHQRRPIYNTKLRRRRLIGRRRQRGEGSRPETVKRE